MKNESLTPELENGINLVTQKTSDSVLHILTSRGCIKHDSTALWIDSGNQSGSYKLVAAGGHEMLEKVEIARAFTTYQHYTLTQSIESKIRESTDILVIPLIDYLYQDGQLGENESKELLKQGLKHLERISLDMEMKTVVTLYGKNPEMTEMVEKHTTNEIDGNRIDTENFDQSRYKDPYSFQTTIPEYLRDQEIIRNVIVNGEN